MKVCGDAEGRGCGLSLPIDLFHVNRRNRDGRHDLCKTCRCEIERQRYAEKADAVVLPQKARYHRLHRDERAAYGRERRATNGDEINAKRRERYAQRRDAINAQKRARYARRKSAAS
jgi:hypothetical protein